MEKDKSKIEDLIDNLEVVIGNILNNQYDGYIDAFNKFMDDNRSKLTKQIEDLRKVYTEL